MRVEAGFAAKTSKRNMTTEYSTDGPKHAGHSRPPRPVRDSQSQMAEVVLPNDANPLGNLLGGRLMHLIDIAGAIAAHRHSHSHVVTASMDHIDFRLPVKIGGLLILKSSVNRAFNTSMEIGVKCWVENYISGDTHHVASAYLTFVAVDEQGKRKPVPGLIPETEEDKRRYEDAGRRRELRTEEAARRQAVKKS
ncbi:MAG: thioesterase domain protein [Candidatus Angelobacter sp.]|jgi:acyl-CoA hydrolase|nr:thioesterase domain protein [Candidatus Angelobacter sp.]MCU1333787.1 thioesterase domain protein [Candidatus Angelobacter sp.]